MIRIGILLKRLIKHQKSEMMLAHLQKRPQVSNNETSSVARRSQGTYPATREHWCISIVNAYVVRIDLTDAGTTQINKKLSKDFDKCSYEVGVLGAVNN